MKEKKIEHIIPKQQTGKAIDAKGSVSLDNEREAKDFYEVVKKRLQNVSHWGELAGNLSANFQLVNKEGIETHKNPEEGNYLKIDIPGPGSKTGQGYDWVQIEEVQNTSEPTLESYGFRVRPAENPQVESNHIAHFYSQESTSTFTVTRNGKSVKAEIYDRNTKPNKDADTTTDKIRDAVVGAAGVLSFSKIQWQNLVQGLLEK